MTVPGDKRALLAAIAGVRAAMMWRLFALGAGVGAAIAVVPAILLLRSSVLGPAFVLAGACIGAALAYRRTPTLQNSAARLDAAFELDELCVSAFAVACGTAHSERFGDAVMTRAVRALPGEGPWSRVVGGGGSLMGAGLASAALATSVAMYLVALGRSPGARAAPVAHTDPGIVQYTDVDKLPTLPADTSKAKDATASTSPTKSSRDDRDPNGQQSARPEAAGEAESQGNGINGAAGDAESAAIPKPGDDRRESVGAGAPDRVEAIATGVAGTAVVPASVPQRYRPLVGAYLAGRSVPFDTSHQESRP